MRRLILLKKGCVAIGNNLSFFFASECCKSEEVSLTRGETEVSGRVIAKSVSVPDNGM